MSRDLINEIQMRFAQYHANERKKIGGSFLVALYNLRLPERQLSLEDKKRLSYVVWLFFEFPQNNLSEPPLHGDNRPPGFLFFNNGFSIQRDMMGYAEPDEKGMHHPREEAWWNSEDFDAFRRNYGHLCGIIESGIEGESYWNFRREDLEWLHEKMSRLIHFSVQLRLKRPVFMVGRERPARPEEIPPDVHPPFIPLSSTIEEEGEPTTGCVPVYLDLPRTGGVWLYEQSEDGTISFDQFSPIIVPGIERDMPPSDQILHQAYLELLVGINNHQKFKRCKAKATKRREDCQNIFHVKQGKRGRGPQQVWCSNTCRRRLYEAKKAKQ